MNAQPRAIVCGPDQRDERTSGAAPPRAPDAGKAAEQVDAVLGKPEPQGKPLPGERDRLPHERDQNLEEQRSEPRSNVEQAARDIESGQLDTDLHNTPGVERVVRERHAANTQDSDRQVANRSADDLADKRGQTVGPSATPSRHRDERQG
ncbi:hypothetical protein [Ralstonia soli]|uniref:Uncharacterized protein n=1 Tax=Ralstonia soli TaxID=2953896 RepID=A0ABT1AQL3_9RALS|nr:hypothetical protein [Ralstonia soli]MCO5400579.1 hypothetical protein [Ralstonia soli]